MRLTSWLRDLCALGPSAPIVRRGKRRRHAAAALRGRVVEGLESRVLLTGISFNPADGRLLIEGSGGDDTAAISPSEGSTIEVRLTTPVGTQTELFSRSDVALIEFLGNAGNDVLQNDSDVPALAQGGEGYDRLAGGAGDDTLRGDSGKDTLLGGGGDDAINGGGGRDELDGGAGNDRVDGRGGNLDTVRGGDGDDTLFGGAGDDLLEGGSGHDRLDGQAGNDTLDGQGGKDTLHGDLGDDELRGSAGHDELQGGEGDDLLIGGGGNDLLRGDNERDLLIAGSGADTVTGGDGDDILIGSTTAYDGDSAALNDILATWTSAADYEDRVAALEDHAYAYYLEADDSVPDDAVTDVLTGEFGRDWFILPGNPSAHDDGEHHEETGHTHGAGVSLIDLDELADVADDEAINTFVPHPRNPVHRAEHFAIFALVPYEAVTHVAVASGAWSSLATWENGVLPGVEANVLIPVDVVVTIDGVFDVSLRTVRVDGTLRFAPTVDTQLKVDTLVVDPRGTFEMGTAATPIAADVTARLVIADRGPIDRAWDPLALSRGLLTHGTTTIHGAATTGFLPLAVPPQAGQTVLVLTEPPVNWNVGDQIVIAGTSHAAHEDEVREILAISGHQVTVAALDYDHLVPEPGLQVHVAHLTRNAVIESESTDLDRRGHVMFMHNRNVDVNYAGFYHLGRTNKLAAANDAVLESDGVLVPGTGTNQRARYSVHFHRNGVVNDGNSSRVHGSVVAHDPGWAYVNHSSFVEFTENVAYDVGGAAFVTEAGDEIGTFRRNIAIRTTGSGERINARRDIQDFGHEGDGFWFQGPGVVVEENVSSGHSGAGFAFYTRGLIQPGLGLTEFLAANLHDPSIAAGAETIAVAHVPILDFRSNVAYASTVGAGAWYHLLDDVGHQLPGTLTHDQPGVWEGFVGWNNKLGVNIPYSRQLILRDFELIGDVENPQRTGVKQRITTTGEITYEDLRVVGFEVGVEAPSRGRNVIDGGHYNNVQNFLIGTAWESNREVLFMGDLTFGTLSAEALAGRTQYRIVMQADFSPVEGSIEHIFFVDTVTLDFGEFSSQQLYFAEQQRDFVPFPAPGPAIPNEYVGKTNEQLQAEFGKSVGGGFPPDASLVVPDILGLIAPK